MHRALSAAAAAAVAATLLLSGAVATPAAPAAAPAFSDEFNDTVLDTAKWGYRTDIKAYSAQRPENVSEAGGVLNIALKKESYAGKSYTGGGVISKQKFRYGYYETRAKINDGAGWHSAFWLSEYGGTGDRTEIDGFEIDSIAPTKLRHNVLTWRADGGGSGPVTYTSGIYDSGLDLRQWHTYGLRWSASGVQFYVDGALKYTAPYTPDQWTHNPTNIWLSAIGWGTEPTAESSVQFDYLRYWTP